MTAAASALLRDLSGRRLGRYEVLIQLASGGMATVYVARAQGVAGFERLVAIKVLHPHLAHDEEFISMFLDEARLAARIRHPNVVPTLDISDTQGDGYFLVMEYVEGDHLGSVLREAARAKVAVPPAVAARMVIHALEGLGAAHTLPDADGNPLGIVHRDVSPHNVLVGADGISRITDFGVAKAEVRLSSTRDGQFKGKLSYMAPEQASSGKADQRSDLFSMGIVLWESLTGRRLFRADNNGELLNRLLNEPIVPPSKYVPEAAAFDAVCARALERDPGARFQTADEFVEAIEDAAKAIGGAASPRVVGKLVRELLGSKIEQQNARIHAAIDALGRSQLKPGLLPLPESGGTGAGSQPSQPSARSSAGALHRPSDDRGSPPSGAQAMTPSMVRPIAAEDLTVGAKPSTLQFETAAGPAADATSKRPIFIALGIGAVALVLAVAIGALVASSGGEAPSAGAAPAVAAPPERSPATAAGSSAAGTTSADTTGAGTTGPGAAGAGMTGGTTGTAEEGGGARATGEPAPSERGSGDRAAGVERAAGVDDRGAAAEERGARGGDAEDADGRHGGRRRGSRRGGGATGGSGSGGSGRGDEDDLIVNPYRR